METLLTPLSRVHVFVIKTVFHLNVDVHNKCTALSICGGVKKKHRMEKMLSFNQTPLA